MPRPYIRRVPVEYNAALHAQAKALVAKCDESMRKLSGLRAKETRAWRNVYQHVTMQKRRGQYDGDVTDHPRVKEARALWRKRDARISVAYHELSIERRAAVAKVKAYEDALLRMGIEPPASRRR